ncbi:uncharacterized protein LOC127363150 [Dicentrarchus labrax]|uniref:uncharacterized protein LOC127363150 n=1 Tax=Dicentrarchus labrax TaxID=13489 RepID=UPI0021F50A8F|nr:uncharacterized protein LOC127363150 [Dicentrarchus labrax]
MKASSVSLLLGVSVLLLSALTVSAVSLEVSPNRPQFFREESVCLKCVGDGQTADGWTVKRTAGGHNEDFGRFDGSCYIISKLSQSDTGVYWCGTSSGQKSNQINITVTDDRGDQVILELPALPVMTGSDVTLRCRKRGVSTFEAFFFKNGVHIGSGPEGQFTISKVQQSDEGLYWCFIDRTVNSSRSWLRVRGPPALTTLPPPPVTSSPPSSVLLLVGAAVGSLVLVLVGVVWLCRNQSARSSADPDTVRSAQRKCIAGLTVLTAAGVAVLLYGLIVSADSSLPALRLFCHLVAICPYCVCTALMASICCSRKTGNKEVVSMEMTQRVGGSDGLDEDYDDITADVNTEYGF